MHSTQCVYVGEASERDRHSDSGTASGTNRDFEFPVIRISVTGENPHDTALHLLPR